MTNKVGRPPKYETAEELAAMIDDYFKTGVKKRQITVRRGKDLVLEEVEVPTITGLVLHLGFADRHSFYDLEKQNKFSHTIKRARTFIENEYEEILATTGNVGAIFALKNFGWTDRLDITSQGKQLPTPILGAIPDVQSNDSPGQDQETQEED